MQDMTHEQLIELRNQLRGRGYDARLVNMGAFDIHQNGRVHYMSQSEAKALLRSSIEHGMIFKIVDYGTWDGRNYWYTFP